MAKAGAPMAAATSRGTVPPSHTAMGTIRIESSTSNPAIPR